MLEEHLGADPGQGFRVAARRAWRQPHLAARQDGTAAASACLDFQDALVLPEGYDLASLVDDPRRTVPEAWRDDLIRAHAAARGLSEADMSRRVDLLSLQRNLRILGIFRRLTTELGRPAYARFLPRTRTLLLRSAGHPELRRPAPAGGRTARPDSPLAGGGGVSFPCLILAAGFGTRMGAPDERTGPRR